MLSVNFFKIIYQLGVGVYLNASLMKEEKILNISKTFKLSIKKKQNSDENPYEHPHLRNHLSMSFIHHLMKFMLIYSLIYFVLEENDFKTLIL